jgi:RNA polymerase sigma-70 factor (ECF subfamily)
MPPDLLDAGTLFRAHAQFVANFLARLGVHPLDLDDLVQEVFLTAHRRGGYVPGAARPTTWLAEIALRVASTSRRTRRRRPENPDDAVGLGVATPGDDPAQTAEHRETLAAVQRALSTLELDRRAVFILFELEGEPCDAIAAGLGVPVSTVYSRLHTARREFTEAFNKLTASGRMPSTGLHAGARGVSGVRP